MNETGLAAPALVPGRVEIPQAGEQLADDEDRDGERQRARLEERREVDAVDVLHDEVGPPFPIAGEIEHRDHVGMSQPGGVMGLLDQHRHELALVRELRAHALDGDGSLESRARLGPRPGAPRHVQDGPDVVLARRLPVELHRLHWLSHDGNPQFRRERLKS